jgi:plastocyanin
MLGLLLIGSAGAATLTVDATSVISPSIYKSSVDEYYGFKSVIEISYKPIVYQNFTLNIHVGDTVNWVNDASEDQKLTIVSEQNLWSNTSAILRWRYQLFNYTFTQPGIYDVYIKEYPRLHYQKIIVNSANYTKIQDAINASSEGDTILVYSGTYYENVNVNKQLTLGGIGMPVVDAKERERDHAFCGWN